WLQTVAKLVSSEANSIPRLCVQTGRSECISKLGNCHVLKEFSVISIYTMQKRQQGYIQLSTPAEALAQKPLVIDPQTEPQVGGRTRMKSKQPNRTTKTSQKLKLFPEDQATSTTVDETSDGRYNQIGQISQGTARREAERLSKQERLKLPRVTAYCTAA
ncbi:17115_t:CDS:2, partial [Dentiscutata heterogama]